MKTGFELDHFIRLIEALDPWLDQVVMIGGWAHRLYRLDPRAQHLPYSPLTTLDSDIAVPSEMKVKAQGIRQRLLAAGFQEEFLGDDRPPVTHYHLGEEGGGFYAEFLTPLIGSEYGRGGKRNATSQVGGVSSQKLRYVEILLIRPWSVHLDSAQGYAFAKAKWVQVANPASFLAQKILIQDARGQNDRAKDVLYIHDTIETFGGNLADLREEFTNHIRPKLHVRRVRKVTAAADALFGEVNDSIREAVLMATGRMLSAEALVETCHAGLRKIFG
jgi:hypothetical protein